MCALGIQNAPIFMAAVPHDGVWPEVIAEAVHLAWVNHDAKLSAQDRFSFWTFFLSFFVLERAARDSAY